MKTEKGKQKIYLLLIMLLSSMTAFSQAPNWLWATSAGNSNYDEGTCIATDNNGFIYVAGIFWSSTITFGSTTLTNLGTGSQDLFLVKYDASGNVIWAKSAGGNSSDYVLNIAVDLTGDVYLTGFFSSPVITFGTISLSLIGSDDMFVVKYDSTGTALWAKKAGGTSQDWGYDITTNAIGNVFVTGWFSSPTITLSTGTLTNNGFGQDMFLIKYDSGGNIIWAKSAGGNLSDASLGITSDSNDNVYITGIFESSTIMFDTITLTNPGSITSDMFITKYDTSGNVLWAKSSGGTERDGGRRIISDAYGNVYVTGSFKSSSITFGSNTLLNFGTNTYDMYVVKYNSLGNVIWAQSAGNTNDDSGFSINTDASGNVYASGFFYGSSITFGSSSLTNMGAVGTVDSYIVKYDSAGNIIWAKGLGGTANDGIYSIATDANNNVYAAGYFVSPSLVLGSITLTNPYIGFSDVFVAKLSGTVGIDEHFANENELIIYPNPSIGNFNIYFNDAPRNATVKIFNLLGEEIYADNFTQDVSIIKNIQLNTSPGIYFIRMNADEREYTGKIIIK
ncbi:MAG: SBBP repeat-containing protein [Bacteroidota bacterium]